MTIQRDDDLEGKVALISGGASGIGQALAVSYARAGAHSVVNYLPEDPHDAQETVDQVEAVGGKCVAIAADVRNLPNVRRWRIQPSMNSAGWILRWLRRVFYAANHWKNSRMMPGRQCLTLISPGSCAFSEPLCLI